MSFSNTLENEVLLHFFNNSDIANVGDATGLRGSTTAGSLHVALASAYVGETGDQTTNELNYTGYGRVAVARSAGGFTVTGNSVSFTANVDFGQRTDNGAAQVARFFSIGTSASGAGKVIQHGVIGTNLGYFYAQTDDNIQVPGLTGVAVNDEIVFVAGGGQGLPTGITEGTVYFVKTVSSTTITISTTAGGATLDITAIGTGRAFKVSGITVNQNTIPRLTTASTSVID